MGLTALDLGLRGAASGVFLMMVLVLLRLRPINRHIVGQPSPCLYRRVRERSLLRSWSTRTRRRPN
jgi:hypothetical protein